MKSKTSFAISLARGCIISGACIMLLPVIFDADALWLAMPITELVIMVGIIILMLIESKKRVR